MKRADGTMLNPIFWKKVQGQKHPGRWGIVVNQIPSIKVLFETSALNIDRKAHENHSLTHQEIGSTE